MKKIYTIALFPLIAIIFSASKPIDKSPVVLIFSKTNGYHHSSINVGIAAIKKLGESNGFLVDTTTDSLSFNKTNLEKYAAVIFLNPTLKVFGPEQEDAFKNYIQHGGGFVGIHSATDCEYNWAWYGSLVGAYFNGHPETQQDAKIIVVDKNNPATRGMPDPWTIKDEWYNFRNLNPDVTVLIKIDESSYKGGTNGANHPMAWYHAFEGGRAFYTALGHREELYSDSIYLNLLKAGIQYAIGK